MGLDMYLKGEKFFWTDWENDANNQKEDGYKLTEKFLELGYWRKHPNLHGFIVNTFANGNDNCEKIRLEVEDLQKIIEAIESKALPETSGFFFGKSYYGDKEEDDKLDRDTTEILKKAIEWASSKEPRVIRSVFYRASW